MVFVPSATQRAPDYPYMHIHSVYSGIGVGMDTSSRFAEHYGANVDYVGKSKGKGVAPRLCYACGGEGHLARNCWAKDVCFVLVARDDENGNCGDDNCLIIDY